MYKNILIPVSRDPSRDIASSLKVATALADKGAHFTLIHVVETVPVYAVGYIPVVAIETNRDEIKTELEGLAATLPNASVFIADGKPGARILRWADENGCDCIIIASHEPVMSDYLLGSTAHQVVRHAKCAVHVVR